jgi:hypothetical protein
MAVFGTHHNWAEQLKHPDKNKKKYMFLIMIAVLSKLIGYNHRKRLNNIDKS